MNPSSPFDFEQEAERPLPEGRGTRREADHHEADHHETDHHEKDPRGTDPRRPDPAKPTFDHPPPSPQNPYGSFLVSASAGSGKTYQLSQRFLFLVGAGALPGSILTVTFTKKAAGEMRSRILEEAARLAADPHKQESFTAQLAAFHRQAGGLRYHLAPLPAAQVAQRVLAASQLLKISTIDSLFLEWVSKFPYEASAAFADGSACGLPTPFLLLGGPESRRLHDRAWRATCQLMARGMKRQDERFLPLLEGLVEHGLDDLAERLAGLDRQDTFLWYSEAQRQSQADEAFAYRRHGAAAFAAEPSSQGEASTAPQLRLMVAHADAFLRLASALPNPKKAAAVAAAVAAADLPALLATGLFTKEDQRVSGTYLRGKRREAVAGDIAAVEAALRSHLDQERLADLSRKGASHYHLYHLYRTLRDQLKSSSGHLEFRDLVKGSYRLLLGAGGAGMRFLLSRTVHHVMLDEFQDTSRLQWAVFHELTAQMLAGAEPDEASGLAPSVFIVGDGKQSIYGFREADPAVLGEAAAALGEQLTPAPLNHSYRTAQVVLSFVNQVFQRGLGGPFPLHATAAVGAKPFVPDVGRVLLLPLVKAAQPPLDSPSGLKHDQNDPDDAAGAPASEESLGGAEQEAQEVARALAAALAGAPAFPVYDKEERRYRPLRAGDCCLLYRSTTKAAVYAAALRQVGIACQREEERGFFSRPEIRDLLALLRFLSLPSDGVALATVLRSPLGRCPDELVLALFAAERGRERASGTGPCEGVLADLKHHLPQLSQLLAELLAAADQLLPHALLLLCLRRLDAFNSLLGTGAPPAEATLVRRNLLRLAEVLMRLEEQGLTSLAPAVERLATMAADDELGNAAADRSAVTLMTIHKAKGLEFPFVILVDTGRPWGQRDLYWSQIQEDGAPGAVAYIGTQKERPTADAGFNHLLESTAQAVAAECQRLLYVALTRARQYLLVSGHEVRSHQGLPGTQVHPQLEAAVASLQDHVSLDSGLAAGLTIDLGGLSPLCIEQGVAEAAAQINTEMPHAPRHPVERWTWRATPQLPREWEVISPSRHEEGRAGLERSILPLDAGLSPALAAAAGTFIHRGLEAFMGDRSFAADAAWQGAFGPLTTPAGLRDELDAELLALRSEPQLVSLKAAAQVISTEMALVHLSDARDGAVESGSKRRQLTVGTLDLLLDDGAGQLLLIDYKTTRFAGEPAELAALPDAALRIFCRQRGFTSQLAAYRQAVLGLRPGAQVRSAVYFTSLRRLVLLGG